MNKRIFTFLITALVIGNFLTIKTSDVVVTNLEAIPKAQAQIVDPESPELADTTEDENIPDETTPEESPPTTDQPEDLFKAKILNIKNIKEEISLDGIKTYIQSYELKATEGRWKNRTFTVQDSEFNTFSQNGYQKNDTLLISHSTGENGEDQFAIIDYARETPTYVLTFLFVAMVLILGKMKGLKALMSLSLSFIVIISFIVPQIINGANPVVISAIGSIAILVLSLYITYGFKGFTHIASLSIGTSLLITILVSQWFSQWAKLTGNAQDHISSLSQMLGSNINPKGLLLAGFIIGSLGVLDDIVINQISLIEELHAIDQKLKWRQLFQKGLKVGIDHVSAIVNSLFLAYVGASLPLLLLFSADKGTQLSFENTINLEIISTEIIRTLTGSFGLILSVPVATALAAIYFTKQKKPIHATEFLAAEKHFHHHP